MRAALAALLVAAAPSGHAPVEATRLAAKVQAFYERTRDLEARFAQTYTYAGFGRRLVSSGRLMVKKPGRMRWDYEKPTPKSIAVTGSRLVQYEPDANQVYVDDHFDASAMSAAVTFLLGKGDLTRQFDVGIDDHGALVLRPKEADPRVDTITLTVNERGEVEATRVLDGSGNVNEVRFSAVRRNVGIPDAAFDVKLPKDVHRVAGH